MRPIAAALTLILCATPSWAQSTSETGARTLPDATPPAEASQFDYLIGDWTFVAQSKSPNTPPTYEGRWTARRAFDGFGIVDEWRVLTPDGATAYLGFTARVFDRESMTWKLQFLNVRAGRWSTQHAVFRDGEMHLWWEEQDADGRPFTARVRYFDIQPDSFRWEMDRSYDGGASWIEDFLTMTVRRGQS